MWHSTKNVVVGRSDQTTHSSRGLGLCMAASVCGHHHLHCRLQHCTQASAPESAKMHRGCVQALHGLQFRKGQHCTVDSHRVSPSWCSGGNPLAHTHPRTCETRSHNSDATARDQSQQYVFDIPTISRARLPTPLAHRTLQRSTPHPGCHARSHMTLV